MKVQCSCGAKHEFEVTPEMASHPVRFVCPGCGLDASEFVDSLVRRELGQTSTPTGVPVPVQLASAPPPPPIAVAAPAPPRPKATVVAVRVQQPGPEAPSQPTCAKHPGEVPVERCYVCSKPICPKCMELFGYVCSPLCKAKAEAQGIEVPVYEGQKSVVEARQWRRVVLVCSLVGGVLALLAGVWIWYAWFGQTPKPVFAVRFPEMCYSGHSAFCGKDNSQIVFLHGDTLARYDLKQKKEIWSLELLDRKKIAEEAEKQRELMQKANVRLLDNGDAHPPPIPSQEKLVKEMVIGEAAQLALHVRGQNVWVSEPGKLVLHDWETGRAIKEVPVEGGTGGLVQRDDELFAVRMEAGKPAVTRISLVTGQIKTETLVGGVASAGNAGQAVATNAAGTKAKRPAEMAGLPVGAPGKDAGKPLDPAKVAEQAQHLSYPARVALPAILAGNLNQERALAEMSDPSGDSPGGDDFIPGVSVSLIPVEDGFVQFAVKLVERRIVERSAMKAAPAKSALEGNLTAANSLEAANEILNEMQRTHGGEMVREDLSRYQVSLKRPGEEGGWTGEVIGPPAMYPLKTVNVLASSKQIIVLDKSNKKLWQSTLNYDVRGGVGALDAESGTYGQGPCVERGKTLYVFDEGVLSAFDLATGNAVWRMPSIGIVGLFFDDQGMIYVNTTSASPESIKYSRQIDISEKVNSLVLKVDSRNGKVLWSVAPGGLLNYVSGKVLLVAQYYQPDEPTEGFPTTETGFEVPPYLRIRRISPRTGSEVWEHFQQRAPLDIAFDKDSIRLVFRKEVQVLKFMTF